MKIVLSLFVLLLLSNVSALSTDLKDNYDQSETVVTEIYASFAAPLTKQQVKLLRGHVEVPFEYDLQKLGSKYFLFFVSPSAPNTLYTLHIDDVTTNQNNQQITADFDYNFTTTNLTAAYTLKPGFVLTQQDFDVEVILNTDQEQTITIEAPVPGTKRLVPGINTISFFLADFPPALSEIKIGSYTLPVYTVKEVTPEPPSLHTRYLRIYPDKVDVHLTRTHTEEFSFTLVNIGTTDISNVPLVYNKSLYKITPEKITKLRVNESAVFNITLISNASFNDQVDIKVQNETLSFPIAITFTAETPRNITQNLTNVTSQRYYSAELEGHICALTQICNGQSVSALDGLCCKGTCAEPAKTSYAWVGYLIGALVLIILVVVGGRYLKSRNAHSNILSEKVNQLQNKP